MNVRRGGLGRGLGALIPTGPEEEEITGARFEELPLDTISPNPRQPREVFDEDALAELVASIHAVGVLQPVVVRETDPGRYQLIMGERRWRASREAGLATIPAIIRETADDALLRDALLENLHRQQLNALEEAAAYQQLLQEFGTTHEELADRIGRSRSHVTNTLRLLNLTPPVQRRVAAGVLSAGHARALLALDDEEAQDRVAARVIAEGLSVRAVEEIVAVRDQQRPERAARARPVVAPELTAVADRLAEQLETRVSIEMGRRRGKLVVEFAGTDDLQRILDRLAPSADRATRQLTDAVPAQPAQGEWQDGNGWPGHEAGPVPEQQSEHAPAGQHEQGERSDHGHNPHDGTSDDDEGSGDQAHEHGRHGQGDPHDQGDPHVQGEHHDGGVHGQPDGGEHGQHDQGEHRGEGEHHDGWHG